MPDRLFRSINGPRGSILLACSALALVHFIAFLDSSNALGTGLAVIDSVLLNYIAATIWALTAVITARGAFISPRTHIQHDIADAWGFALIASCLTAWGMTYFLGFILEQQEASHIFYGTIYWAVATMAASAARMTNRRRRLRPHWGHKGAAR